MARHDDNNPKISFSETRKNVAFLFSDIWREDKILILLLALDTVGGVALPFFGIYLPRLVVSLLTNQVSPSDVWLQLGGFTLAMAAAYFICKFAGGQLYFHINDFRSPFYDTKIFLRTLDCEYRELKAPRGENARKRHQIASISGTGAQQRAWSTG